MILAWIRGTGGIGTSRFWIYLESKANRICGGAGLGRRVKSSAEDMSSWKCVLDGGAC